MDAIPSTCLPLTSLPFSHCVPRGAGPNLDPSGRAWGGRGSSRQTDDGSGGFMVSSSGGREPMAGRQVLDGGHRSAARLHEENAIPASGPPPGTPLHPSLGSLGPWDPSTAAGPCRTAHGRGQNTLTAAGLSWEGAGEPAQSLGTHAEAVGGRAALAAFCFLLEPACRDGRAKGCWRRHGRGMSPNEKSRG